MTLNPPTAYSSGYRARAPAARAAVLLTFTLFDAEFTSHSLICFSVAM
jgi:deoxycytidine triphosphate deaminase